MKLFLICIVATAGFSGAEAASISPSSYAYEFAPGGATAAYQDPSDTKLTDAVTVSIDPADGTWVGFTGDKAQAGEGATVFFFASSQTITDIAINFLRYDPLSIEVAPTVSVTEIGGSNNSTNFTPANLLTNDAEAYIHLTGSWTGSELVVTLGQDQTFSFINDVKFNPSNAGAAPEPGTVGMALAGLAAAIGWSRRRKYSTR